MKTISVILAAAMSLSVGVASTHAASVTSTSTVDQQFAHQGGKATHRHCHTRIKKRKLVKVCHKHHHRVLHHLRTG